MADAAMMNIDKAGSATPLLPTDPFRSLLVHFGMLLGVDDFETVDAYHRGKMWLHSAWLHRQGAIWGLEVSVDQETGEIKVKRGLALDTMGRELYLENDACLNLARWYEEHRKDPQLQEVVTEEDGVVTFNAYVEIRFKGCLARQVPTLSEPCEGADSTRAYSRVVETVELTLIPGNAHQWRTPPGTLPFHRLRLLFGLEGPLEQEEEGGMVSIVAADQEVLDRRQTILNLDPSLQPAAWLEAFREFSVLDEMELKPVQREEDDTYSLYPGQEPGSLPLADISNISLQSGNNGWQLVSEPVVDNSVRPVHVPTSTIQELLCGPICRCIAEAESPLPLDGGGPRVDPGTVTLDESGNNPVIRFDVVGVQLLRRSVAPNGISVTSFDSGSGWHKESIDPGNVDYQFDQGENRGVVTLTLNSLTGSRVRLIVRGTGEFPLLGHNGVPLAGAVGGPPGGEFDGHDFVFMFKRGN